jgi:hypothetical protein
MTISLFRLKRPQRNIFTNGSATSGCSTFMNRSATSTAVEPFEGVTRLADRRCLEARGLRPRGRGQNPQGHDMRDLQQQHGLRALLQRARDHRPGRRQAGDQASEGPRRAPRCPATGAPTRAPSRLATGAPRCPIAGRKSGTEKTSNYSSITSSNRSSHITSNNRSATTGTETTIGRIDPRSSMREQALLNIISTNQAPFVCVRTPALRSLLTINGDTVDASDVIPACHEGGSHYFESNHSAVGRTASWFSMRGTSSRGRAGVRSGVAGRASGCFAEPVPACLEGRRGLAQRCARESGCRDEASPPDVHGASRAKRWPRFLDGEPLEPLEDTWKVRAAGRAAERRQSSSSRTPATWRMPAGSLISFCTLIFIMPGMGSFDE